MLSKYCTQYVSKFGKPISGHRTGKGQSSSQFLRKAILKNVQTTVQLHSSPMPVRLCSECCMLGFSIMWTENFQMSKLGLDKAEGPGVKIAYIGWIIEKEREFQKTIYLCFIDYNWAFDYVHFSCWTWTTRSSLNILWHCLSLGWNENGQFSSPMSTAEFSKFAGHILCSTFTAPSFRILNSPTGIPSPPLAFGRSKQTAETY